MAYASTLSGLGEGVSFATLSSANPEKLPSSDEVTKVQMPSAREQMRQPRCFGQSVPFPVTMVLNPSYTTD